MDFIMRSLKTISGNPEVNEQDEPDGQHCVGQIEHSLKIAQYFCCYLILPIE